MSLSETEKERERDREIGKIENIFGAFLFDHHNDYARIKKKLFPNKISFVQQDKIISEIYAVIFRNLISNKIFIHNLLRKYDYTVICGSGITETDYMFLVFKTYFVFYFNIQRNKEKRNWDFCSHTEMFSRCCIYIYIYEIIPFLTRK